MQKTFLKHLVDHEVIMKGDFVLRSGKRSPHYINIKKAIGVPELLVTMTKKLAERVPKQATCIAATGYGGVALATLVATRLSLPLVLVRDKRKDHGTQEMIDGYVPKKTDRVCIVDDVFTTGSSMMDVLEKLSSTGCSFTTHLVVVDRSSAKHHLSVQGVLTEKDLISI
jgi:orotate phosphoribosyltransferase